MRRYRAISHRPCFHSSFVLEVTLHTFPHLSLPVFLVCVTCCPSTCFESCANFLKQTIMCPFPLSNVAVVLYIMVRVAVPVYVQVMQICILFIHAPTFVHVYMCCSHVHKCMHIIIVTCMYLKAYI